MKNTNTLRISCFNALSVFFGGADQPWRFSTDLQLVMPSSEFVKFVELLNFNIKTQILTMPNNVYILGIQKKKLLRHYCYEMYNIIKTDCGFAESLGCEPSIILPHFDYVDEGAVVDCITVEQLKLLKHVEDDTRLSIMRAYAELLRECAVAKGENHYYELEVEFNEG